MKQGLHSPKRFKDEVQRKMLHLPAFAFPVIALISRPFAVGILIGLMIFYTLFELRADHPISQWISKHKRVTGFDPAPLYLASGLCFSLMISPPLQAFFAAYVVAICDSAAALVGLKYGHHPIGCGSKTWEGSFAFGLLAFAGAIFFLPAVPALMSALVLTLAEIFFLRGLDNLVLPVLSQLLLLFFSSKI